MRSRKNEVNEINPDISIAIINSNNLRITLQCLESIHACAGDLKLELTVVNNACRDGSTPAIRHEFPNVRILENETMLGFSTNNNRALEGARRALCDALK